MAPGSGAVWKARGSGTPVTLVVHGLGATEGEARIPASGVRGTRVVVTLPGHGDAAEAPPGYWDYGRVAEDVLAIADEVRATRAIGVSLGAGALTRAAARDPHRFERLALLLPAALDRSRDESAREPFVRLAEAVDAATSDGGARLRALVADDLPSGTEVGNYVEDRAAALMRLGDALRTLPEQCPLADAASLAEVTSDVLVVGATGDELHPAEVAEDVAGAFPRARLELLPSAAPMLTHRHELRRLVTGLLN
ncbi:alpha/beta hydrolase family protein [Halopolyspora algeriensis]|uniref:Alpha/beta hydrolase family protein n=1 Tax=Halopolyspora algeriensis TaxID=1500506 RepID=A0A368VYC0_9ACTN|nr:alpha/beta hydrolase [Halopolyspora algeriensis]RCW46925.1 alpha/beta hydrolase family protein [Halopolyspora algeriensis]TQM48016.1 alpha/beta hydrolase family protein [Halopolyspora algeriensis]